MNWIKWVLISLAIAAFAGAGGYAVYYVSYAWGDASGYNRGYSVGRDVGYGAGEQDGYSQGYISGQEEGYDKGYDQGQVEGYDKGYDEGREAGFSDGYIIVRDPTYEEAVAFMKEDETSDNEYIEDGYGVYVCSHFARDVCNQAEVEGLRCAFVELRYAEGGHAIVGFDTLDEGMVYFDAMTDEVVKPEVGKRYYKCIVPKPGYIYLAPFFDDTILDILVIW